MAQKHNSYEEKPMTRFGSVQGPSRRYRRLRHPTFPASEWADKNPLLQRGELGIEKDTHKVKAGDGITYWNDLPYLYDDAGQPLSTADYQMGNAQGGWTTMSQAQQDALNSGATTAKINQIATNTTNISNHIADTNNPHSVTKTQVGLGNVDNTSDLNKPISTATQSALDSKVDKNAAISGATHTKITYDSKGLVTGGSDITLSDVTDITATASEVNVLDGITATTTELNYVAGVTSSIQSQIDGKQATISDLATIRSNASAGKSASDTIATYGDIVTHNASEFATSAQGALADSALQPGDNISELVNDAGYLTQHQSLSDLGITATASEINVLDGITATTAELNYTDGVTSNIQSQLNGKQATISDLSTIRSGAAAGATAVQPGDLATVATTGSYSDLSGTPTIGNATLTIQKNSVAVDTFTANATVDKSINITVPVSAADVNALPDSTKYVANASMTINNTTYVVTLQLKDQDGNNIGTAQTIDLPLESVVVGGSYDSTNKKIVLTLKDGSTIDIPVGDLVAGLQTEITSTNKLDADLVDDSTSTNKFVTASDKTTWNGKQDAISDLATIRSNASSGASAYTTIQGYGNIVTHSASEFATSAQGALADTALQSGDNVSELVNDAGYITGITGSDVTTALGYTPYNSSNPSGYQANVIESIKVNGTAQTITAKAVDITVPTKTSDLNNDSGFITKSVNDLTNYTLSANLASVATTGTLASLTDTTISSLQGGQVLMYDADTGKWKNTTSTSSISWGGITGTLSDQTDLNTALSGKQATITGAATTITANNLSAARALVSDSTGKVAVSTVTSTELGYMHGVTSAVQTQLNNKQATLTAGSNITISGTTISATDTTYTAGSGIDITSNVISVADLDCGTMS